MDVNSIKYKPAADARALCHWCSGAQQWNPDDVSGLTVSEIKNTWTTVRILPTISKMFHRIRSALPTNLQLNADYAINRKLYVELAGRINLQKDNYYNSFY